MIMARNAPPTVDQIRELRQIITLPKRWLSAGEMPWVDAGGKPKGFTFREHLALEGGLQPATLFVDGYFKPSTIEGSRDKLSLCLFYKNSRILGIDDDGASRHRNVVGVGRPLYQHTINHPHLHTVSDDSIDGYAEPLPESTFDAFWSQFLEMASIEGGPRFSLPPAQRELLLP
jgi:hypothetical protein